MNIRVLLLIFILFSFSGCDVFEDIYYTRTEFCLSRGYYVNDVYSNYEWASREGNNYSFYCVDLENKNVSNIYSKEDLLK